MPRTVTATVPQYSHRRQKCLEQLPLPYLNTVIVIRNAVVRLRQIVQYNIVHGKNSRHIALKIRVKFNVSDIVNEKMLYR